MNKNNGLAELKTVDIKDVEFLIGKLSIAQQEEIIKKVFSQLPVQVKARIIGKELSNSGLKVIAGATNMELCTQIQNAPDINAADVIEALVNRCRTQRQT